MTILGVTLDLAAAPVIGLWLAFPAAAIAAAILERWIDRRLPPAR